MNEAWCVASRATLSAPTPPARIDCPTGVPGHPSPAPAARPRHPPPSAPRSPALRSGSPSTSRRAGRAHRRRRRPRRGARLEAIHNRPFIDPCFAEGYPADVVEEVGDPRSDRSCVLDGDRDDRRTARRAGRQLLQLRRAGKAPAPAPVRARRGAAGGPSRPTMGWAVVAGGLSDILAGYRRVRRRAPARDVTESGAAFAEEVVERPGARPRPAASRVPARPSGQPRRRNRRRRGPPRLLRLVADRQLRVGQGLRPRFGVVYVDFADQRRIPKRSALWYRDRIAAATGEVD